MIRMKGRKLAERILSGLPVDVRDIYISVGLLENGRYVPGVDCGGLTKTGERFSYQFESSEAKAWAAAEVVYQTCQTQGLTVSKGFFKYRGK